MKAILVFILVALATPAWARLGESEAELTNRYGAVIQAGTNGGVRTLTFNFGEYLVQSRLREGKSVVEFAYLKKKGVEFAESDALAVASRMAGANNWRAVDSAAWQKTWLTGTNGFYAQFNNPPGRPQSIMVSTVKEMRRSQNQYPSSDSVKGF